MKKQITKRQVADKQVAPKKQIADDQAKILHVSGQIMQRNLEAYRNLAQ